MDDVGQRIRDLRQKRDWTLKQLADRCDLSTSFLSQVERGLSSVSITSLHIICQALGITLADFFGDSTRPKDPSSLVRGASEVTKVADQPVINVSDAAIRYRFLSHEFPGRQFEILIGEISPGYHYPPAPHEGEEFGYVLEGQLKMTIGDEVYALGPGDSYHFSASIAHGYEAESEKGVKVLWVQTLKYFQARDGVKSEDAAAVPR